MFALPHVLGAPTARGRHVPHGHLGSHGDSPSSPMSSVHPASRGQILTQPQGLLAAHRRAALTPRRDPENRLRTNTFRAGTPAVSLQAPLHRVQRGHVRVSLRCGLHAIVVPCLPSAAASAVLLHSGPLEARLGGSLGPWPYPFVGPQDRTRHRPRAHVAGHAVSVTVPPPPRRDPERRLRQAGHERSGPASWACRGRRAGRSAA